MSLSITASASAYTEAIASQLAEWTQISTWLDKAKEQEMILRKSIATHFFPAPVEGVNKLLLPDGSELKLTHKINRNIDETNLNAVMDEFPPDSPYRNVGVLVGYKPVLVMDGFRALSEQDRLIFAQTLEEKPGAPALELVPAKEGVTPDLSIQAAADAPTDRVAIDIPGSKAKVGKTLAEMKAIAKSKHPVSGRPGNLAQAKKTKMNRAIAKKAKK